MGAPEILPTVDRELSLLQRGYRRVAGLDEVGVGCIAGPVVAAAVIFPPDVLRAPGPLTLVRDSKIIPPEEREDLSREVQRRALAFGVGIMPSELIDAIGIAPSIRLAMAAALAEIDPRPDFLLVDYQKLKTLEIAQESLIDGDALCFSIAAASIVAKAARDALMRQAEEQFPGYAFAQHKGYGTPAHHAALERLGPSPIHRRSFSPLRFLPCESNGHLVR